MKIKREGGIVKISGIIDENADFSSLLAEAAPLTIDFSGVERINSVGVRAWMRFMTQWGDKDMSYVNCSVIITEQLSMIPALLGIKKRVVDVQSAAVAFDCPACGHQEDMMIHSSQVHPVLDPKVSKPGCPNCKQIMETINPEQISLIGPRK
jgi:anti-anti-sigma regulatory factor